MDNAAPWLWTSAICCVIPAAMLTLGVMIGRHGSPIKLNRGWLNRSKKTPSKYSEPD